MKGFGNLNNFDALKSIATDTGETPLIESVYTQDEIDSIDNVIVPILENDSCVECGFSKMEEQEEQEKHEEPEHHEHEEHHGHEMTDKANGGSGNEAEIPGKEKQKGSAGNSEEKEEEAIMGGMGMGSIGGGIKKEMARMEGFESNQTIDEAPMENATDKFNENSLDKIRSVFNDMYDNKYVKAKNKEFDYDGSVAKSTVSSTPIKQMPKGW